MNLFEDKKGIGTNPGAYIVELKNSSEDQVVQSIFIEFVHECDSAFYKSTITATVIVNHLMITRPDEMEEKEFTIRCQHDIRMIQHKRNDQFKKIDPLVVATIIGTYIPTNWFLMLPERNY